jgi:titin
VNISNGSNNVVLGNYIGTDVTGTAALGNDFGLDIGGSNNLIGGTTPAARNIISGNNIQGGIVIRGTGIRALGNFIGTDVTGTYALANREGVIVFGSGPNQIGGTEPGAGNLISGSRFNGINSFINGTVIQGNMIGTDVTGTLALPNGLHGIQISGGSNDLVGGTETGAGNLISGNARNGILISSVFASGADVVQGNRIGTDVTGTQALGNGGDGVHLERTNNNTVGGEAPGAGNIIAFNGNDGVLVDQGTGNAILGNAIFANANLGIELVRGGNHNQEAPVITSATTDGTSTTVTGTLSSAPNSTFTLEFFATNPSDPSGAEQFLGSVVVTTDADGNASFTVTIAVAIDPGWFLTATATDAENNTSRFSDPVELTG